MKILIINTLYYPQKVGGAEISVQLLAESLVNMGHQVRVISLIDDETLRNDVVNGVSCGYYPMPNIYWPYKNGVDISRVKKILWHFNDYLNRRAYDIVLNEVKNFDPDIVHTNNLAGWSVSVWSAAKKCNKKIIHTTRDYYLIHYNSTLFNKGKIQKENAFFVKVLNVFKRVASKKVDGFVGISNFIRQAHINGGFFPSSKKYTIYNSVTKNTENKIIPGNGNGNGNGNGKKRFGFIGRLTIEKGFDIFCKIAKNYKNDYMFYAAGDYVERDNIYNLAVDSGVNLMGHVTLDLFLSSVDIVILPIKWNEPFGRVVVESILSGKIVITTPVGGISELAEILPNIYLSDNIEKDFISFLDKEKKELTDFQEIRFNAKNIADEYLNAYEDVIM
ncbi:glycosyltransferase family 4 protein [Klebsiella quasipneumoniae]|uniref:glycosyltransferase family 4 protein n=1 Tax=Klebsiella TaxID=570 RepID=UPI001909ECE0|nr:MULTISPECIES: glycosyltransferase family 4 protein [Klebsiella]MBK2831160.1 glycosyltransferase [Klebsiella quasipneumoniae]MDU2401010.1 glycosyltransferase family 4 protein [Klebsiella sp.]MDU2428617.1 glycosyltransferase family 4 protein [Klebsiella sp.]MDU2477160.1 glycosyltransferase family 4 protein [Klebsiella sp.]MDU2510484.1 glycosyltransferase family 4 protein [Klebsiella sp.]